MMLHGIDISHYQAGLNVAGTGADFIICKATEGTGWVDQTMRGFAQATLTAGKLLGLYHFASGGNPRSEAEHYVSTVRPYIGRAILILDWEPTRHDLQDHAWVRAWLDEVYRLTGVRPWLYASASVLKNTDWTGTLGSDYGVWVAGYLTTRKNILGDVQLPATHRPRGKVTVAAYQYTSTGKVPGWAGRVDLDVAYMDKAGWTAYATPTNKPASKPAVKTTAARPGGGKLTVDGWFGKDSIRALQRVMGTPQDGVISSQPTVNKKYVPHATSGWGWVARGAKGSPAIKAWQKRIGTPADGYFGVNSVRATQKYVGAAQDGIAGKATMSAWQTWLNKH
ncbi:MAG: GH25 family lysozyme [Actinomycetaceae bacterium]|nr:GH25 family lysozyme [Actinomycetaceae bacterium]MDY6082596.1 GH25 family lysozyme [Actinomycetaceae bacterium]